MQNALQSNANYDQHNAWYNSMFATTEIKTEPMASPPIPPQHVTPPPAPAPTTPHSQLEQYLKHQHQQNLNAAMNATSAMTPSPHNNDAVQHFFDVKMQQQIYQQQQQYQQQFRQAQQQAAAAQNQMAASAAAAAAAAHLPLGFNPLTPPGLPMTTLPHFYNNNNNNNSNNNNNNNNSRSNNQHTPSPQPVSTQLQLVSSPMDINSYEKLQSALTPRNTPPMETQLNNKDMNPPTQHQMQQFNSLQQMQIQMQQHQQQQQHQEKKLSVKEESEVDKHEHETMSNSSEDLTNLQDEAKYYESIHVPRYNSHGKLRTYPCKSCPQLYDTKAEYWEHLLTHMKPEKILRCPMYPKCPFVTEYKHFLDFHLKKHRNQKPFKCPEGGCKYSCETKGMLTSHLKSHSDVYPYKCGDCDYAVKFIHSFKQHLRKYEHKPGLVLDDKGKPNPAAVIDVYGRRRGPKSKGASTSSSKRDRSQSQNKSSAACTSQLSAALQGIKMAQQAQQQAQQQLQQQQQQQQQLQEQKMCISPAKSNSSSTTMELPTPTTTTTAQHKANHQTQQAQQQLNSLQQQHQNLSSLLPPLASILQQNTNMAFFPYWNLNLQMLAAQQQAVVLAQLSPRKREIALQQLQNQQQQLQNQQHHHHQETQHYNPDEDTDDEYDDVECKSIDSAMDLSQPAEEERRTPESVAASTKTDDAVETPIGGCVTPSRRKGRVLQLDTLLHVQTTTSSSTTTTSSAEKTKSNEVASTVAIAVASSMNKLTDDSTSEESMENGHDTAGNGNNTSASSTSNDSGTATSTESDCEPMPASKPAGAVHECKYCDIYFKDPVLYTIHMGYHSCDDVFKCNMCGEKCDGPVGLFVHMARNAHA